MVTLLSFFLCSSTKKHVSVIYHLSEIVPGTFESGPFSWQEGKVPLYGVFRLLTNAATEDVHYQDTC